MKIEITGNNITVNFARNDDLARVEFHAVETPKAQEIEWSGTLGDSLLTFAEAEKACADLRIGDHDDWRLPTLQELQSIVNYTRCNPAIDTTLFPDTQSDAYWAASPVASYPDYAWFVNFSYGSVYNGRRGGYAWVRAVRGPRKDQP